MTVKANKPDIVVKNQNVKILLLIDVVIMICRQNNLINSENIGRIVKTVTISVVVGALEMIKEETENYLRGTW